MSTASTSLKSRAFQASVIPANLDLDERELLVALRATCIEVMRTIDDAEPPLRGRCIEVSYLVRAICRGAIVTGRVAGEPHYWNRLPSEIEIDLTSDQFG